MSPRYFYSSIKPWLTLIINFKYEELFMTQATRQVPPLSKHVREALEDYFNHLDGHKATNLYTLVLEEIEQPLFKAVMKHTKNNQSCAANILGLSRGTLRKKLKQYKLEN